jgi:hypothetical protein
MIARPPSRLAVATLALAAVIGLLADARGLDAEQLEPSVERLQSLVEGYAHAIETNNRELALWYVHPHSPWRSEADAALRDQLASYLERARTSDLERIRLADGMVSATVDQEIIRVAGMKFTRGTRRSIYYFRALRGSWRIWGIEEVHAP